VYLPHFDDENWPAIARLLLQACELVDRGEDATMKGTVTDWLRGYLEHKPPHNSLAEADEGREPFLQDGDVHIFSNDFRRWLNMRLNERVKQDDLTANLRALGAVPVLFDLQVRGKSTSRSAWKLPNDNWSRQVKVNSKGEGKEDGAAGGH